MKITTRGNLIVGTDYEAREYGYREGQTIKGISEEELNKAKQYLAKLKCLARNNIRLDEYAGTL